MIEDIVIYEIQALLVAFLMFFLYLIAREMRE
jgi:hypothetical protein